MSALPGSEELKQSRLLSPTTKGLIAVGLAMFLGVIAINKLSDPHLTTTRKSAPLALATSIESAVNNFYTEYGRLPTSCDRLTTDSAEGMKFLNVLLGTELADQNPQNQRSVRFLAIKESKKGRGGIVYSKSRQVEGLYDSWGGPLMIEFDMNYDEILEFNFGSRTVKLKGRRVAVHSAGPDRKSGTADDVTTW